MKVLKTPGVDHRFSAANALLRLGEIAEQVF
jgi:hypothetical protein